jgi:iron complex outermembrane recepter protein
LQKVSLRRRLMSSTVSGGFLAFGAGAAFAQTAPEAAPPPPPPEAAVKEVVVTGSRIPRPNLTSVSPITAVSSQEIKLQGATDVADVIDNLPQSAVGINSTPNPLINGLGYTTANLRNLGAVRTLVLMDGKRLAPGDPSLGADVPDLDTVPTQLVDRVEVVTGGASAVYGSDAVAGVVNFIMKRNFEGVQLDAQYGINQHNNGNQEAQDIIADFGSKPAVGNVWDGRTTSVAGAMGANTPDGRGNVTAFLTYKSQSPVSMGRRDFAGCQLVSDGTTRSCTGSPNSNLLSDKNNIFGPNGTNSYQVTGGAGRNTFVKWGDLGQSTIPPQFFNSNPFEFLSRQEQRFQGGYFGHYEFAPYAQFYSFFTYTHDSSQENIAPGGSFLGNFFTVNCDNPFLNGNVTAIGGTPTQGLLTCQSSPALNAGAATIQLGRRNLEGGPRESFYSHDSFLEVFGLKGALGEAWTYDLSGSYARTTYTQETLGFFSKRNLQNALQVQNVIQDPTTGKFTVVPVGTPGSAPVCLSVINGTDPLCKPYNPFVEGNGFVTANPFNGVTQDALNYVEVPSILSGETTQQIATIDFVGQLGKYGIIVPWATEGVGVSVGAEYRREFLTLTPDAENTSGDLDGGSGVVPLVEGAFTAKEWYAEMRIPFVQDHDFAKDLVAELGYRRADYRPQGTVDTYKLAAEWAIDSDIRLRGSFQRAVRAPNVNELFFPVEVTNTSVLSTDPCAGTHPTATLQQCERTGVLASQFGTGEIHDCPAEQCGAALGGNAALKPEQSNTTSLGIVLTPQARRSFNFSVDYFNINVNNAILGIPVNVTMTQCLNGNLTFCPLIHRNAQGEVWGDNTLATGGFIEGNNQNIGFLKTAGFDFEINDRIRLEEIGLGDHGAFNFNFIGTYVQKFVQEPVRGLGSFDCAGFFGPTCTVNPQWRHKLRVTWATPWKFQLSWQWRFLSGQTLETFSGNPLLAGFQDQLDKHIPDFSYLDIVTSWQVSDRVTLRAGVNNILDKDPPWLPAAITGSGSPNSFPLYDLLGRNLFVSLTANW